MDVLLWYALHNVSDFLDDVGHRDIRELPPFPFVYTLLWHDDLHRLHDFLEDLWRSCIHFQHAH